MCPNRGAFEHIPNDTEPLFSYMNQLNQVRLGGESTKRRSASFYGILGAREGGKRTGQECMLVVGLLHGAGSAEIYRSIDRAFDVDLLRVFFSFHFNKMFFLICLCQLSN